MINTNKLSEFCTCRLSVAARLMFSKLKKLKVCELCILPQRSLQDAAVPNSVFQHSEDVGFLLAIQSIAAVHQTVY